MEQWSLSGELGTFWGTWAFFGALGDVLGVMVTVLELGTFGGTWALFGALGAVFGGMVTFC